MNEFIAKEGNRRFAFKLIVMGAALCICAGASAQEKPVILPPPLGGPDLIISSLSAKVISTHRLEFSFKITNVGAAPADLNGPTSATSDNVRVQAKLSKDTVFGNSDDAPAGGTALGPGTLAPGASRSGTFATDFVGSLTLLPHLVLKVDPDNIVRERDEKNNTAAVGIARQSP